MSGVGTNIAYPCGYREVPADIDRQAADDDQFTLLKV